MYDNVIRRVEGPGVVVVQQCCGFVWPFSFHIDEGCGFAEGALCTDNKTIAIIGATVGHIVALWTAYFVTCKVCRREEFHLCNDDGFVLCRDSVGRRIWDLVGGYEESICLRVEHAGFMEVRSARIINEERKGWRRSEEVEKRIVVDEEGFWFGSIWRDNVLSREIR